MEAAQRAKRIYQTHFERLGTVESRLKLQEATVRGDQLLARPHDTSEAYRDSQIKVAHVSKSCYKTTIYNARPCLLDYALCKLENKTPMKGDQFIDPLPEDGYLSSINWAPDATEIGTFVM